MGGSDYKLSNQSGYVLVERRQGYEVTLNEQPAMLKDISAFCKEANCQNVLIRGPKTRVKLSPLDIHDLGKEIAKLNLRIAVAESHDASDEDEKFLENVVWNRSRPIKFFNSEMEAKYWLLMK